MRKASPRFALFYSFPFFFPASTLAPLLRLVILRPDDDEKRCSNVTTRFGYPTTTILSLPPRFPVFFNFPQFLSFPGEIVERSKIGHCDELFYSFLNFSQRGNFVLLLQSHLRKRKEGFLHGLYICFDFLFQFLKSRFYRDSSSIAFEIFQLFLKEN